MEESYEKKNLDDSTDQISIIKDEMSPTNIESVKISKNELKRRRKAEKWNQIKILKKAKKDEMKLDKMKNSVAIQMTAHSSSETELKRNRRNETEEQRKLRKEQEKLDNLKLCAAQCAIVIDCSWEKDHADRPLKSLSQQILFCYGINRRTDHPSKIYLTGVGPRLLEQISKNHINEWVGIVNTSDDYIDIIKDKELIYLTSDAKDTLEDISPNCAYIIGGIVDRNSMKGATFAKASTQGVRTMKLPLKEYCSMKSTPVLTVNHVFEIITRFKENGSWVSAFEAVLPQRKGVKSVGVEDASNVALTGNAGTSEAVVVDL